MHNENSYYFQLNRRNLLLSRSKVIAIIYDSKTNHYVLWLNDEMVYCGDNRELMLESLNNVFSANPLSQIIVNDPNLILDYEL